MACSLDAPSFDSCGAGVCANRSDGLSTDNGCVCEPGWLETPFVWGDEKYCIIPATPLYVISMVLWIFSATSCSLILITSFLRLTKKKNFDSHGGKRKPLVIIKLTIIFLIPALLCLLGAITFSGLQFNRQDRLNSRLEFLTTILTCSTAATGYKFSTSLQIQKYGALIDADNAFMKKGFRTLQVWFCLTYVVTTLLLLATRAEDTLARITCHAIFGLICMDFCVLLLYLQRHLNQLSNNLSSLQRIDSYKGSKRIRDSILRVKKYRLAMLISTTFAVLLSFPASGISKVGYNLASLFIHTGFTIVTLVVMFHQLEFLKYLYVMSKREVARRTQNLNLFKKYITSHATNKVADCDDSAFSHAAPPVLP